jgi:heat shock protein 4
MCTRVAIYRFTDAQRRAVLDASSIAGLNVLRLLNETAATALAWGLPKTMELPEDSATPKHVLFFDMGHSTTQVCLVAFSKSKMTVLASAFDRNLGGRDVDMKILNLFAAQWKEKRKLNIHESPKAVLRLITAIDKVKQQLSGYNSSVKLPVNVECLQDDYDFTSSLSTEELTELTEDLVARALEPCKKVVNDAKLSFDQIDTIEVVGSATRSPLITNALQSHFGKVPQRTLNSEEAVAKGCALMGAMMSPNFRVREFAVADCSPYPISLSWTSSGGAGAEKMDVDGAEASAGKGNVVFTEHNVLPSTKMLTFMRNAPFEISSSYADASSLSAGCSTTIGVSTIAVPASENGEATRVKVKVRLDINGILAVDSAQAVEEVEVDEPVPSKVEAAPEATTNGDVAMPDVPPAGDPGASPEAATAEPAGQPAAEEAPKEAAPEPQQKKKKLKKQDLAVVNKVTCAMNARRACVLSCRRQGR